MQLPRTREEITCWALEHSGVNFLSAYVVKTMPNGHELGRYEAWIRFVYEKFPDIVTHDRTANDTLVYFAHILVMTTQVQRMYEMDLLNTIVRHHYNKYGEFL